jgi:RimJ/RimL family protein N-acetyltransferase
MRNPVLIGERVYLRALEPDDAEPFARMDAVEADTFMYRQRFPSSPMEHAHWIEEAYKERPPHSIPFAVGARADDRLLGVVGVDDLDWVNRTGETFSFLGPAEVRGQGYGTEAKHLLLGYCFDRLHLHVLRSEVDQPNTRSAAALLKQGYRRAGALKWVDVKGGRYIDQYLFDVTRPDWIAAHRAWLDSRGAAKSD